MISIIKTTDSNFNQYFLLQKGMKSPGNVIQTYLGPEVDGWPLLGGVQFDLGQLGVWEVTMVTVDISLDTLL